jgi:CysZ protein
MQFLNGIKLNWRGLIMGLTTPRLLALGAARFILTLMLTVLVAGLVLTYHQQLLGQLWTRPDSAWIVWLWHLVSWLLALLMVGVSAVMSYLVAQVLFAAFLMDLMSRITEKMVTGRVAEAEPMPFFSQFLFLVKQEIPRAVIPVLLTLVLMLMGWLTPLGPVIAVVTSGVAIVFLAWDNSDLVPARRMAPFRERFAFLCKHLSFHLGFGVWFLIPIVNILFLSFAPVGGTLFHLERT